MIYLAILCNTEDGITKNVCIHNSKKKNNLQMGCSLKFIIQTTTLIILYWISYIKTIKNEAQDSSFAKFHCSLTGWLKAK